MTRAKEVAVENSRSKWTAGPTDWDKWRIRNQSATGVAEKVKLKLTNAPLIRNCWQVFHMLTSRP